MSGEQIETEVEEKPKQLIKPGFFIEKVITPQVDMHSNKLEVAYWLTFSLGITFIVLAILGLKYSFAAGNTTMRVILSISHISTFYNLFLLNV